ncbi:chorismate synthase [Allorhodopirellula heiligendammensis]|uniref:Chorismate synthase n=1 Tax=Allorhodopirellula heiligendammensis TaxID=2714739 RepID=A0A5C6BEF0_9BACT|nr:chorismate synthase [Allorhodopirellula heiligendammensis]TWU10428.1 Chorismate synthase [Allorhodopirellula heiligendammensis]
MEVLGGPHYAVAGAGESHGPAITTIIHGCPPGHRIGRADVQPYLDRRRPGGNKHGTPRNEKDKVVFLSGLYQDDVNTLLGGSKLSVAVDGASFETEGYEDGFTTGEPIAAIVLSTSKKSGDYTQFTGPGGEVRPGHTDLVKYHQSQGFVDVRGGGRSSYRSTISDVIGGSVARIVLQQLFGVRILSSICQVGSLLASERLAASLTLQNADATQSQLDAAEIPSIDMEFASAAGELIKETRRRGDSLGAAVEVVAVGVPPLLGSPLYQSLKVRLMGALGGLNAVQSCEIGAGVDVIERTGSVNNDPIRHSGYQGNTHGGLLGGITTGNPVVARVGFKPTSTINLPQQSVTKDLREIEFELAKGRHDPCVGVRAGVTLESRVAIELLNALLGYQGTAHAGDPIELF